MKHHAALRKLAMRWIRILFRYVAGWMVAQGMIDGELANIISTDPDLVASFNLLIGALLAAVSEAWYSIAKRMGWEQ